MITIKVNVDISELKKHLPPISEQDIQEVLQQVGEERRKESLYQLHLLSPLYHERRSFLNPKYSTPFHYIRNRK